MKEFVKKLIKMLERHIERNNDYEDVFFDGQSSAFEWTISVINKLAEEYNDGWIPCSEKCPPNDTYCLITDYKGDISIEKHLSGNCWFAGFNYVVAWQPLPKPYKELTT